MLWAIELEPWVGALAILSVGDAAHVATTINKNGSFTLESVPAGNAALRITSEQGSGITLAGLELA